MFEDMITSAPSPAGANVRPEPARRYAPRRPRVHVCVCARVRVCACVRARVPAQPAQPAQCPVVVYVICESVLWCPQGAGAPPARQGGGASVVVMIQVGDGAGAISEIK